MPKKTSKSTGSRPSQKPTSKPPSKRTEIDKALERMLGYDPKKDKRKKK